MMNMKYLLAGFSCAALLALAPTSVGFMDVPQVYAATEDDFDVEFDLEQQNISVYSDVDTKIYVSFPTVKDGKVKDGKWASYDNETGTVNIDLSSKKVSKEFYVQIKGNKSAAKVYHLKAAPSKLKAVVDNVTGTVKLQSDKKDLPEGTALQYSTTNGDWNYYNNESLSKYQENGATLRFRVACGDNSESKTVVTKKTIKLAIKLNDGGNPVDSEGNETSDSSAYVLKEVEGGAFYDEDDKHYAEASADEIGKNWYKEKEVYTNETTWVDTKEADTKLKDSQNKDLATYEVLDTFASDEVKVKIGKRLAGPRITANYANHTITVAKGNYRVYQGTTKVISNEENATSKITITLDNKIAEDKGFLKDEVNTGNDTYITEAGAVEAWLSADTSKNKARSAYTELAYDAVEQLATKAGATCATDNYVGKLEVGETTPAKQVTVTTKLIESGSKKGKYDVTIKNGTDNKYEIVVSKDAPIATTRTSPVNANSEKTVKAQERSAHVWVRLAADTKKKIWSSDFVDMGKLTGLPAPTAETATDDCTNDTLALTLTENAKVTVVDVKGEKNFSASGNKITKNSDLAAGDSVIFEVSIEDNGDTATTIYKATCKTVDSNSKKSTWEIKEMGQSELDGLIITEEVRPDNDNASKRSLAIFCPKDATIKECKEGYVYKLEDGKCTFTKNEDAEFSDDETFNFTVTLGDAEKTFTAKVAIDESDVVTLEFESVAK